MSKALIAAAAWIVFLLLVAGALALLTIPTCHEYLQRHERLIEACVSRGGSPSVKAWTCNADTLVWKLDRCVL